MQRVPMIPVKYRSVNEYIAAFPEQVRAALRQIRQAIREAAPHAEETISHHMPTSKLNGRPMIYFSAWKRHIGMYGASGALEAFREQVAPYAGEKGSVRVPLDRPLPLALIRDMVTFEAYERLSKAT